MMRFRRPPVPKAFKARKSINDARRAVAAAVKQRRRPEFAEHWKAFKDAFSVAQHGKCGYCDHEVASTQAGDVEHFAPKGEVWALGDDPETWGKETIAGLSNISGRGKTVLFEVGYWWLAYEWRNYLFACTVCNSRWKLSYFPVQAARRRSPSPRRRETVLLLNCFDDSEPWAHLRFSELGQVEQQTERGFETIRTCGLDRETLRAARQPYVKDAYDECMLLLQRPDDRDAIRRLVRAGAEHRIFASAVRSVARDLLGVSWHELEAAAGEAVRR